jgi:hypothetical protein
MIKVSARAAAAAFHCLQKTDPKGRSEIRLHSALYEVLEKNCVKGQETCEAEVDVESEPLKFLSESVAARVKEGVPGVLSRGYNELASQLDGIIK